uniref:Uncharacterized protein n=1 Tax=Eutreptiella gymnastica TaxID=73025 RepID=A0A7S4LKM8_9EUGL
MRSNTQTSGPVVAMHIVRGPCARAFRKEKKSRTGDLNNADRVPGPLGHAPAERRKATGLPGACGARFGLTPAGRAPPPTRYIPENPPNACHSDARRRHPSDRPEPPRDRDLYRNTTPATQHRDPHTASLHRGSAP